MSPLSKYKFDKVNLAGKWLMWEEHSWINWPYTVFVAET